MYTEKELAAMLDLSESGLQKYRYDGRIGYVQHEPGTKVFYSEENIKDFIKENSKKRKRKPGKPKNPPPLSLLVMFLSYWENLMPL